MFGTKRKDYEAMHANLKKWFRMTPLLALGFAISMMAQGQTSAPKTAPADERGSPKTVTEEKEVREGLQAGSAAALETDRSQRWMDQELLRMRQQFEREALDRMRLGRPQSFFDRMVDSLVPLLVFLVITWALLWILRIVLDNRRWYRMVKVQTEIHTKLLDRFGSSQDMVAYMESDAGKRFLESPSFDIQPRQYASFPYGRILLSAQVGLIVATLGVGLLFLRGRVPPDGDAPMLVIGTTALTLGLGFVLSAVVSYALSRQLGLLERPGVVSLGSDPNVPRG